MTDASTRPYTKKATSKMFPGWFWPVVASIAIGVGAWAHTLLWSLSGRVTIVETHQTHVKATVKEIAEEVQGLSSEVNDLRIQQAVIQDNTERILQKLD